MHEFLTNRLATECKGKTERKRVVLLKRFVIKMDPYGAGAQRGGPPHPATSMMDRRTRRLDVTDVLSRSPLLQPQMHRTRWLIYGLFPLCVACPEPIVFPGALASSTPRGRWNDAHQGGASFTFLRLMEYPDLFEPVACACRVCVVWLSLSLAYRQIDVDFLFRVSLMSFP